MAPETAATVAIRILYHRESQGWWAESPDLDGWSVAAESYEDVRRLAEDGLAFALANEAEDRGEGFEEERFASMRVQHDVPAPS